jgi:predicted CXXCH cytochrome family protein
VADPLHRHGSTASIRVTFYDWEAQPMKFRDVEHLFRLAAIFLAFLVVFLIARAILVPADFGVYGHYRASAVDDERARLPVYAGQQTCADCHSDIVEIRAAARHAAIACESCHGPLAAHANDPDALKPKLPEMATLCVQCHAARTGKPKRYPTVDVAEHAGGESCATCHSSHNPRIQ